MSASALLLAAGRGTRLRPLTDTVPKCLVPFNGKPLADYWLDALIRAGIERVRINTHHHAEQVRDWCRSRSERTGLPIAEAFEPELLGSAGTITANRDLADGVAEVVIVYVDNLSGVDLLAMLEAHRSHDDPMTMLLFHATNPTECGIADVDENMLVTGFTEKPRRPRSDLANGGLYVVDAPIFREMADRRGFDIAFDLLPHLVGRMRGWVTHEYHRDIGTRQALETAERDLEVTPSLLGPIAG